MSSESAPPDAIGRRPLRGLLLILLLIGTGIGLRQIANYRHDQRELLLVQARIELTQVSQERQLSRCEEIAARGAALLEQYVKERGDDTNTGRFLLGVLLQYADAEQQDRGAIFLSETALETVSTEDLTLAAEAVYHRRLLAGNPQSSPAGTASPAEGQFGQRLLQEADRLVQAMLLRDNPGERGYRIAALLEYEMGREEAVLEHCRQVAKSSPGDPRPWMAMAQVYIDRDTWPQVVEALREAQQRGESNLFFQFNLVLALIKVGDAVQAREEFAPFAAMAVDPSQPADQLTLLAAQLLFLEGNFEEAAPLLERYVASNPKSAEGLLLRGQLLLATMKYVEAEKSLRELIRLEPSSNEGYYTLGQVLARQNQQEEAALCMKLQRGLLDKKVALYAMERNAGQAPGDVAVRRLLAKTYAEIGLMEMSEHWQCAADAAAQNARRQPVR